MFGNPSQRARLGPVLMMVMSCVVLLLSLRAAAHDGEAPPGPPAPPGPVVTASPEMERVYAPRWSWLHWWEANRDSYLTTLQQQRRGRQKPDPRVLDEYRGKAAVALRDMLALPHAPSRAAAAVALGKIGEASVLPQLQELAKADPDEGVRVAATMALGLLDSPTSEKALLALDKLTQAQSVAQVAATGLLSNPGEATAAGLHRAPEVNNPGVATAAAWALQHRGDPQSVETLVALLGRGESHWITCEAMPALGRVGDAEITAVLIHLVLGDEHAASLPAWARQVKADEAKRRAWGRPTLEGARKASEQQRLYEEYRKAHEQYYRNDPNPPAAAGRTAPAIVRGPKIVLGQEMIALAQLRASAAIALGQSAAPEAPQALLQALGQKGDDYSDLYRGFVIMALGQHGYAEALPPLVALAQPFPAGNERARKRRQEFESPLRGYAALALGLYARPVETEQGLTDRPGALGIGKLLAERVADARETMEMRCASAVGLGLSGRGENLRLLQQASTALRDTDEPLLGYVLLGRGMLADRNILEPAQKFLATPRDREDMNGILARRAAVLGLGVLGTQEAIPLLVEAWRLNYYTNREVILALALCEAYNISDGIIELRAQFPEDQVFVAQALGELFVKERPSRLSRFLAGRNYTVKNAQMAPFQAMANEFFANYLLPAFGDQWR